MRNTLRTIVRCGYRSLDTLGFCMPTPLWFGQVNKRVLIECVGWFAHRRLLEPVA